MKPIVLITPGKVRAIVISPLDSNSHTQKSWDALPDKIMDACIKVMSGGEKYSIKQILSLVTDNPDWKCQAIEVSEILFLHGCKNPIQK